MRNKLLIVTLVVILLGVAVGTPLYVLGKQKAELNDTISALQGTMAELETGKVVLQATVAEQGDTIADLQVIMSEQEDNISSLGSQLLEQFNANVALQDRQTEFEETMSEQSDMIAAFEAEKEARLSQAQELYDFATEGLIIWEALEEIVLAGINLLQTLRDGGAVGNSVIMPLINTINALENEIEWLYAPPSAYQAKDALLKQCDLSFSYIAYISGADQARRNGDEDTYSDMRNQAVNIWAWELWPLQEENRRDLIDLQLQAEQDLNQQ